MPDKWMNKKRKISKIVGMVRQRTEQASVLLLVGEENIGISCLLKKTAAYLIARESGKQSRKWVYLDLKDCRSILQVLMSSQIRRNKHTLHGLREVLNYLKGVSAVMVLDHCDKVAFGRQFQDLIDYMKR